MQAAIKWTLSDAVSTRVRHHWTARDDHPRTDAGTKVRLMLSIIIPIGGALVVVAVALLTFVAENKRARIFVLVLALAGVAVAECGYLRALRKDRSDHEAVF